MLHESGLPRNSSYLVPCVFKAVHMIEALRETSTGLRVEDLRSMTGYSRTTIYRILRTLVACRYIMRNSGGVYRLNYSVVTAAGRDRQIGRMVANSYSRSSQITTLPNSKGGAFDFAAMEPEWKLTLAGRNRLSCKAARLVE
jgi:predicted transcriptional regulator